MNSNEKSKVESILSEEELHYCQTTTVGQGSGQIVELDWDEPELYSDHSRTPLSDVELEILLLEIRDEGANLQETQKRIRCRELRSKETAETKLQILNHHKQIAFESYLKESIKADSEDFTALRSIALLRKDLSLAIYTRVIAELNILNFHEAAKTDSMELLNLISYLKDATETADALKSVLNIELGLEAENDFLTATN